MHALRPLVFTLYFILCIHFSNAQNWFFNNADTANQKAFPKISFLQIRYQVGRFVDTGQESLRYIEDNPFNAFDFRYGIIGYGRKKWHPLHYYPTYGLGVTKFFFHPNDNILGNPFATYIFFNQPILTFKKSKIAYDFDLGLSYGWKPYDPQTNPEQKVIGSSINFIVMFGLQYEFKLSNRLDGIIGANLNHMSNGRIQSPNRGVDQYATNVSIRYRLVPRKPKG